jgi:hypothetical protein
MFKVMIVTKYFAGQAPSLTTEVVEFATLSEAYECIDFVKENTRKLFNVEQHAYRLNTPK